MKLLAALINVFLNLDYYIYYIIKIKYVKRDEINQIFIMEVMNKKQLKPKSLSSHQNVHMAFYFFQIINPNQFKPTR